MAFNREGRELFPAHVPGEVDEVINLVSKSPDAPDAGTGLLRAQSGLFQDGAFLPSGRTRCFTPTLTHPRPNDPNVNPHPHPGLTQELVGLREPGPANPIEEDEDRAEDKGEVNQPR